MFHKNVQKVPGLDLRFPFLRFLHGPLRMSVLALGHVHSGFVGGEDVIFAVTLAPENQLVAPALCLMHFNAYLI